METLKKIWAAVDEKFFALAWLIATIAAVYFLAPGNGAAIVEIVVLKMIYVAVLLTVSFGLLFFLRGTKCDIYGEIFDEHNSAAALLIAALLLSIALVIGK